MIELLALRRRQPILAAALVTVGLRNPIADRLGRRFEIPRQFLGAAAGSNQVNHLPAELRRITWVLLWHGGLRKLNRSGVHESGATSVRQNVKCDRGTAYVATGALEHRAGSGNLHRTISGIS